MVSVGKWFESTTWNFSCRYFVSYAMTKKNDSYFSCAQSSCGCKIGSTLKKLEFVLRFIHKPPNLISLFWKENAKKFEIQCYLFNLIKNKFEFEE